MPFEKPTDLELENRYTHHPPKNDQADRHQLIRKECGELARLVVRLTPCSPEQARALNALDEVMLLASAAIARRE